LLLAIAGAAVALTAGFAGVTFVRLIGLVVLGPPARETGSGPSGSASSRQALGWRLARTSRDRDLVGVLSPSWLWIVMPLLALVVIAMARLFSGGRLFHVRRVPVWRSATAGVEGADSYTATGFANPTRRVLAAVLHTRAGVQSPTQQPDGQQEPADDASAGPVSTIDLGYDPDVIESVEAYLYRPALIPLRALVRTVKRLQSGRLDAYLAYMLIALVALIAVAVALA
jgi:hydrogenase-4 component B